MTADPIDTKRKIMKQNERSMPINVQLEWTDSLKIINYKNRNKKKMENLNSLVSLKNSTGKLKPWMIIHWWVLSNC